jgi:hypothetical protein
MYFVLTIYKALDKNCKMLCSVVETHTLISQVILNFCSNETCILQNLDTLVAKDSNGETNKKSTLMA